MAKKTNKDTNSTVSKGTSKSRKTKIGKLNAQHEKFCKLFVNSKVYFGQATKCYAAAYNKQLNTPEQKNTVSASASRLLTNVKVLQRIDQLLSLQIDEEEVDSELAYLIRQNGDKGNKLGAIREYNRVKGRVRDGIGGFEVPEGSKVVITLPDNNRDND